MNFDNSFLLVSKTLEISANIGSHRLIVHMNVGKISIEQIAQHGRSFIQLAQHTLRWLGGFYVLVQFLPALEKILHVLVQLCHLGSFGLCANNDTHVCRPDTRNEFAKAVALHVINNAAG